jgi:hypothetical protein
MSQVIDEITNWFEAQKGNTLTINKRELSIGLQQVMDNDELELNLDKIEINTNTQSKIDDYIGAQELALYGNGKLQSDQGITVLPDNVYTIPLTKNLTTRKVENGLQINTERAKYSFQLH